MARFKRNRFTRDMLIDYLSHFGIAPDDKSKFGRSVVVRQIVDWNGYTNTLSGEREYLGLPPVDPEAAHLVGLTHSKTWILTG